MIRLSTPSISSFTWSTSEQVWPFEKDASGKTLYCQEIDFGALPNNGSKSVAHGIALTDPSTQIFNLSGTNRAGSGSESFNYSFPLSDTASSVLTAINSTYIVIITGYNWSWVSCRVRVIYSK